MARTIPVAAAAAATLALLAFAACGSDEEPASKPTPTTMAPKLAGKAFPGVTDGIIEAGTTYATTKFKPAVKITPAAGAEWNAGLEDGPEHFALSLDPDDPGERLLAFHRMKDVFDPERGGAIPGDAVAPPDSFADWLASHPHLKASEPQEVEVLGRTGKQIDVTVRSFPERAPEECGKADGCLPMFNDSRDLVWYSKSARTRFIVLDGDEKPQIVIEMYVEPRSGFPDAVARLEETLATAELLE